MKHEWEDDEERFPSDRRYKAKDDSHGIAWKIYGWHVIDDEDTHWTGIKVRTGNIVAVMVGDDYRYLYDPDDFEPINDDEFCHECGQIGCKANQ